MQKTMACLLVAGPLNEKNLAVKLRQNPEKNSFFPAGFLWPAQELSVAEKEQQDKTDTDMGYSHACVSFVFLVFPRCRSPPSESLKTTHFSNSWR